MTRNPDTGRSSPRRVDINSDVGESFGAWTLGDAEVLRQVTSANIACGFHAGDPTVMRRTVQLAREAGAAIGAHPGLPDLAGFGRRWMEVTPEDAYDMIVYQVGALGGVTASQGVRVRHVKPHGALYNMAAADRALADAIARAVRDVDRTLVLFGLAGSELVEAGRRAGLATAAEAFPDRGYAGDGTLLPRSHPQALVRDADEVARRAVQMVVEGHVEAADGSRVPIDAQTLCVHGDAPGAALAAAAIRAALTQAGVVVAAPGASA